MNIHEMRDAVRAAEITIAQTDRVVDDLALLLSGRLRSVTKYGLLKQLKKELASYNSVTGVWKE